MVVFADKLNRETLLACHMVYIMYCCAVFKSKTQTNVIQAAVLSMTCVSKEKVED
jgi:hypothetical protein